jgi:hypothetical protein
VGVGEGKFSKKEISNFVELNSPKKNLSAEGSVDNDKASLRSYKSDLKSHKRAKSQAVSKMGNKEVSFEDGSSSHRRQYMDSSQKGGLDTPSGILKTSSMSLQRIEKDYRDRKDDTLRFELPAPGRRANKPVVPEVRLNFTAEKHNFAAESLVTIPEEDKFKSNSQNSVKSILKKSKYLSQKSISENKSQKSKKSHKKPKFSERSL